MTIKMLWVILCLPFALATVALADEPPPPPPAPTPADGTPVPDEPLPPATEPAEDEEGPVTEDVWTPPITETTRQASQDMLPDPVVRDPKTGRQTGGTPARTPSSPSTTARRAPTTPDTSTARTPPITTNATRTRIMPSARIENVTKLHNKQVETVGPALQLDVEFTTQGLSGRDLYVAIWFVREDSGDSISPVMEMYADGKGRLSAQTQPVRVTAESGRYAASLWVPYGAFPSPDEGDSYGVEARVLLIARGSAGTDLVLSRSETTFTVHAAGQ